MFRRDLDLDLHKLSSFLLSAHQLIRVQYNRIIGFCPLFCAKRAIFEGEMQRPPAETGVAPKVTPVSTPVPPAVLRERNDQFSLREQLHRFLMQSCIPVVTGNAPVAVALRGNGTAPVHGTGTIDDAQRVTLRRIVLQRISGHIQRLFHDVIRIQRAGISEKGIMMKATNNNPK